jgi:hypothetical protein
MSGVGTGTTTCKEYLFNQLTAFRLRLRVSLEADMRIGHCERLIASPNRRIQAIEVSERARGKIFVKCVFNPYCTALKSLTLTARGKEDRFSDRYFQLQLLSRSPLQLHCIPCSKSKTENLSTYPRYPSRQLTLSTFSITTCPPWQVSCLGVAFRTHRR